MNFQYTRYGLSRREWIRERMGEILPGLTSWLVIIGMIGLVFFKPLLAACMIIVFDFYWLLRLFYMSIFLLIAYLRLSIESRTHWNERIEYLDRLDWQGTPPLKSSFSAPTVYEKISQYVFLKEIETLLQEGTQPPLSTDIMHLVIVPVIKEAREIVEPGIECIAKGHYDPKKVTMVIALEERADEKVKASIFKLQHQYRSFFYEFLVAVHPEEIPGEAKVKGANVTYAAKTAKRLFEEQGILLENVILSCFDADTVISASYFSCLTYHFMVCPQRYRASFQPIPVYHNNIWDAPSFARVLEMGSSFFQLSEATNPEKLVTFSSHSMSFKALVEVGYWPVDMISDDSAIFWKCFIHFDGDYRVIPMYVTVSMDVVNAENWWKAAVNVYRQKRRWAWGVENFPIVLRAFIKSKKITLVNKVRHGIKLFEGHLAWATWPLLLGVFGWLPALFSSQEFSGSVLYYSAPRITGIIFHLATLCLVLTIILSLCLLPQKKIRHSFFKKLHHALEWFLVPLIAVFFSALPALDAQTRLMLGRYMEFWVTDKPRKPQSASA